MNQRYIPYEYEREDVLSKTTRRGGIANIPNEIIRHEKEINRLESTGNNGDWEYAQDLKEWVKWLKIIKDESI